MNLIKRLKRVFYKENLIILFKNLLNYLKKHINEIIITVPFVVIEIFTFLFATKVKYTNYRFYSVILFDICWYILFIGFSTSFKKIIGKVIYLFFTIIFCFMYLVNHVYFSMTKNFFDFNLIQSASEGAPYIFDALKNCNILVYLSLIFIIISFVFCFRFFPKKDYNDYKKLSISLVVFLLLHLIVPFTLGSSGNELSWSNWKKPRAIYNLYNDSNKSLKVSGLYEYTVRNFYITFIKTNNKITEEDIEFLNNSFSIDNSKKNSYTSKLKGKNLIVVQLEGIDNWLLNKNDTPTLYKMMKEGYNFTDHYSYYNGGGSTFNSEFAVNTGFITPLSYVKNAYTFNKNSFPYSLANQFKSLGYSVNAFHMNTGEYYSRELNYSNWGYDNYYSLMGTGDYKDDSYTLDRELILNENFNKLLFPTNTNFVDYIITYSGHLPFTNTKGVCKKLYDLDNEELLKSNPNLEIDFKEMSEEECVRRQAKETDYMMELLLKSLKEKKMLDNTAIVVFSDHYLYTLEDQSILKKYKNTSNNLINKTPFFIWSNNIKSKTINKTTSQLNILPTILNLYGITYNKNNYIGLDALTKNYSGIVFFSDYSWYDGNVYVEGGDVTNKNKISKNNLIKNNDYISFLTKKNDLALKYNYFKMKKSK